jgi:DnaJ-class molecular chaperone
MHTHYDNLKVARTAPHAVVKAAYRALSQQYHPDRNAHPDAVRIMKILNDAWAVLGDSDTRAAYDRKLAAKEARSRAQETPAPPASPADAKAGRMNEPAAAPAMKPTAGQTTASNTIRTTVSRAYILGCVAFVVFVALCLQAILYLAG